MFQWIVTLYSIAFVVEEVHGVLVMPLHRQADSTAKDSDVGSATRSIGEKSLLRSGEYATGHSGKRTRKYFVAY